jgi:3-hydroxyisobutyrate dehydrogenase-like beta-hydroxyacid dehydrogenase
VIVGLLHPGEMGAAVGDVLVDRGHEVLWASAGRSDATRGRAARFADAGTVEEVAARADAIVSICPPHAALEVASAVAPFDGLYLDANAVSPQTAQLLVALFPRYVDGGIVGGPPRESGTRLYLSGPRAREAASLFEGSLLEPRVVTDASALKMAYSAWSKGSAALLLATRDVAERYGVGEALAAEWADSVPELEARLARAERSAAAKGWRWIGEMEEIADTFAAAGAPDGFHRAAAEVYRG